MNPYSQYNPQERKVAYFSMEIGLAPELPIYSGGLGILAGDTAYPGGRNIKPGENRVRLPFDQRGRKEQPGQVPGLDRLWL